jgi:CRISPR/Cas system-associated exonuclease Cas4 (RecB family)
MQNIVDTILLENIDKPASLFIFPTNVAASRWADRILRLRRGGSVAMEKFIAWDTFKQNSIRSKVKDRQCVPAVLRKMFVNALIRENAELCDQGKPPVFSSLIRTEWARQANSFAGWLTKILPQLGAWRNRRNAAATAQDLTGDDRDLFTLALRYAQFLEQHGLFEPAWETPPFEDTGRDCFVFFPESLSDFSEYKDLLAASNHVKTISVSDSISDNDDGEEQHPYNVFFYTNSRSEITEAALYILALHKDQNVSWDSISVSIPDDEHYGPYLFKEFENRNIPYIMQSGKPLASYPAGQFFTALAGCAADDFSFASLKELLLNQHLPWKDSSTIQELIDFGINNNCISSWIEETDGEKIAVNVWEDAFTHPLGGINPQTRRFFEDLKRRVNALCRAGSFSDIRRQYFAFRERFLDMENCLDETNLILSRCISELVYLIEIEKSFPDVHVPDHYGFFIGYLAEINYLAQQSVSGVAILPYRTAAPAPFDCHIVLGASQSSLSAVFSPLAFLPKSKREELGITDNDASLAFIKLHRFNSRLPAAFFCAEQTFSGYAIPHSSLSQSLSRALSDTLDSSAKPMQRYGDDPKWKTQFAEDLYRTESSFYASLHSPGQSQMGLIAASEIHHNQKQGFEEWQSRNNYADDHNDALTADHPLLRTIRERFCYNEEHKDKISVSASSLALYFQCPLRWAFSRLLKLENVEIETGLMASNITGEVYHAVLNLFLEHLKETDEVIAAPINSGAEKKPMLKLPQFYSNLLTQKIETVFEAFPRLPHSEHQVMSMLTARLLRAEKPLFFSRLENLLAEFTSRFADFKVVASEESYTLPGDNYFLNGRIDCILEENNSLVIVDFKTKYKPQKDLFDFQLPLYLRLAEESYKKEVHAGLFFSIIDARHYDGITRENDCFNEVMDEFDQKTRQFVREISSGAFSFFPSNPEQCQNCEHNKVCRTLYKVHQGKSNGARTGIACP